MGGCREGYEGNCRNGESVARGTMQQRRGFSKGRGCRKGDVCSKGGGGRKSSKVYRRYLITDIAL